MKKIPAILCDIDGLLLRGRYPLPKVIKTLHFLRSPLNILYKNPSFSSHSQQLPVILLTNGGSELPQMKLEKYNEYFDLKKDSIKLKTENVILNYSPLAEDLEHLKEKLWVISGMGAIEDIAQFCGFTNAITLNDLADLREIYKENDKENLKKKIFSKKKSEILKKYKNFDELMRQISGYMILDDIYEWDLNLNIILQLLSINSPEFPIVLVHDDKLYPDQFPLPRMALGMFNKILQGFSKKLLKKAPNFLFYGKPTLKTFEFVKKFVRKNWSEFEISNFYMLGDNPETDILGGNRSEMQTILVKTGVYSDTNKEKFEHKDMKAKFIVEDFYEAIKLIGEKEGFEFSFF